MIVPRTLPIIAKSIIQTRILEPTLFFFDLYAIFSPLAKLIILKKILN